MLTRKGEYIHNGKPVYAYYGAPCESCLVRAVCAGENRWKMITSYGFEGERQRMAVKMRSEEGKEEYRKRSETVEWPFGDIKQNFGLREFLTRGLQGVRTEYNLVCIGHNLKILWKKLDGKIAMLEKKKDMRVILSSNTSSVLDFCSKCIKKIPRKLNC